VIEPPKPPPKDELTIELEKLSPSEETAKELKATFNKYKEAKGTSKTDLLRLIITNVELFSDDKLANLD